MEPYKSDDFAGFFKKCLWDFDGDCITSVYRFGYWGHVDYVDSSDLQTRKSFPFLCVFFNLF